MRKRPTPYSIFINLLLFTVLAYSLWRLVQPEVIKSILQFLVALGISGILCFTTLFIFGLISEKAYQDHKRVKVIGNHVSGLAYYRTIEKSNTNFDTVLIQTAENLHRLDHIPIEIEMTNYGFRLRLAPNIATPSTNDQNTNSFFVEGCTKIISPIGYYNRYYYGVVRNDDDILSTSKIHEIGLTTDNQEPILSNDEKLFIVIVIQGYMKEEAIDHFETLEKPVLLIITPTTDDLIAVYREIDDVAKQSQSADDDSWMYKSRPYY